MPRKSNIEISERPKALLEKIREIRREIEDAKSRKDVKIGKRESAFETLKREHGIETVKKAKTVITDLDDKVVRRSKKIDKMLQEIEEEYEI